MYGEKFCEVCGTPLPRWGRYDQRTCGAACRKKLSRRADAVAKASTAGIASIRDLQEKLAWKGYEADVVKSLELMRDLIDDALGIVKCDAQRVTDAAGNMCDQARVTDSPGLNVTRCASHLLDEDA